MLTNFYAIEILYSICFAIESLYRPSCGNVRKLEM